MQSTFDKIYEVVKQIPYGQVATYGQIAALAGNRRWSRVVGYALHVNPDPEHIPCYRVVNRYGLVSKAFAFGGENRQIALLEAEGVECKDGRVDLARFQWEIPYCSTKGVIPGTLPVEQMENVLRKICDEEE